MSADLNLLSSRDQISRSLTKNVLACHTTDPDLELETNPVDLFLFENKKLKFEVCM